MGTCKKILRKGCTWLPALAALAVITATLTPAFGQVSCNCGGTYASSTTPATVVDTGTAGAGNPNVAVQITLGSQVSGGTTTNTEDVSSFFFVTRCAAGSTLLQCLTGSTAAGITWEGGSTISTSNTTCKDATTATVSWSVTQGTNTVTLTPSAPVHFSDTGQTCTVNLTVAGTDLNTFGTIVEAGSFAGSCTVDGTTTCPGGNQGSNTFDVNTCGVGLVKQLSCDGGANWNTTCTAFTGDPLEVRYQVTNTRTTGQGGLTLNSCTVHDVTGTTIVPPGGGGTEFVSDDSVGTITIGTTTTTDITSAITTNPNGAALTCNDCGILPTAPIHTAVAVCPAFDEATVDCVCGASSTHVEASAQANHSCETCSVNIDKQVSCDGGTTVYDQECCTGGAGVPFGCSTDGTTCDSGNGSTQSANCIGFDATCSDGSTPSCSFSGNPPVENCTCATGTLVAATNVQVNYFIQNTGQDSVTCSGVVNTQMLGFSDSDVTITAQSNPVEGTLNSTFATGATQEISAVVPCNPSYSSTSGAEPDTAMLNCSCGALTNNSTVKLVSSSDTATFSCQQPKLALTKTCGDTGVNGTAPVTVTATNTGDVALTNCVVTDQTGPGTCPAAGTTGVTLSADPTANPGVNPASFTLNASGSAGASDIFDGTTGALTANACNNASIVCNIGTSAVTIGATATATCHVGQGCEGATPGFFKNRPEDVDEVILADSGGTITSCGLVLNNAEPNQDCSILNDLAMEEPTLKKANTVDPTYRQLVLQCAVAELNLQGTIADGGNCGGTIPGTDYMFDTCCGLTGVCAQGKTVNGVTISDCQAAVASFNADRACLNPAACVLNPQAPAEPSEVKSVTTLNDPSSVADCGGSRTWVFTTKKH